MNCAVNMAAASPHRTNEARAPMKHDLQKVVHDLRRQKQLVEVREEVDPYLEMAAVQRRVFSAGGPALLFSNVKGCRFPAVSNLFGTLERGKNLLRHGYEYLELLLRWQEQGRIASFAQVSWQKKISLPFQFISFLPKRLTGRRRKRILAQFETCRIQDLPQIQSWPQDGGSFILLPQVYTADPRQPHSFRQSNLGMYRIQMQGENYTQDQEIGLHYQTHRGIGLHHKIALETGKPLPVSIFVGGPPAHCFAAVFPAPEFVPEICLAGLLNNRRYRYLFDELGFFRSADADFCILGTIGEGTRGEGPFGDHLGYYSLQHPFPYLNVSRVLHKPNAIWPFTVVGRPPQEDTIFGAIIHELTAPLISKVLPGVRAVHAVDESGVHPLLLALGRETYNPYAPQSEERPQEILTLAHRILGFGQLSLAKYLLIMNENAIGKAGNTSDTEFGISNVALFFANFLSRTRLDRDLHFVTKTNMDTLDYSGEKLNQGSKLIWAAGASHCRDLLAQEEFQKMTNDKSSLADFFKQTNACWVAAGILSVCIPAQHFSSYEAAQGQLDELIGRIEWTRANGFSSFWRQTPLLILSDAPADMRGSSADMRGSFREFLWVTFTRSNPAYDIYGCHAEINHKHWSCQEPLIIDARLKPHHSPPLQPDAAVESRVDRLAEKGASLHGIL